MDHEEFQKNMNLLYKKAWGNKKDNNGIRLNSTIHYGDDCGSLLYPPVNEQWLRENFSKIQPNGYVYNYCLNKQQRKVVDKLNHESKKSERPVLLVKKP